MSKTKVISIANQKGGVGKTTTELNLGVGEEEITDNAGEFACTGGIEVAGVRIKCWRYYRPHGAESLRQALMNSCNPVFIGLGQKFGIDKYYGYLEKFGLLDKTSIIVKKQITQPGITVYKGNNIYIDY